jgi:heptosyltransferase-2
MTTPVGGRLVVTPGWVGDIVMCQSLLKTLRAGEPAARLDVLAPEWARPLLERMPEIDAVIALPVGHGELRPLAQLRVAREVRGRRYQRAIVTRRSFKAALVPFLAGIPVRTGIRGEARFGLINDVREVDGSSHPSAVVRLAVLGMEPGARPRPEDVPWPELRSDHERAKELERTLQLGGEGVPIGLAPGAAFGPAKRWPQGRWEALARELTARGYRVWVFGARGEAGEGAAIAEAAGAGAVSLCGRTTLADVVDLMSRCDVVVSNDSGLMHVAAASGPRVVALFGSTSPENTPPLQAGADVLWRQLECSPCYARTCPLGHLGCLEGIEVQEVVSVIEGRGPADGRSKESI